MPPAARLRPVPETAPRAIGLIRVSKERDGMISPEVQRTAINDYAAARGYTVTGWLEGLDESGSRSRSAWWPRLDQAIAAVETGEYDVVLVWKFSRTARHRLRWAVAIDRIEEAGGRLESATEQVDTTTSTGRFTRGMLAELNAFEAERIGEVWKEVHARRVASGRPANGKPRWGYTYDSTAKLHRPDPEAGPVLADLYRRYVAGESVYTLVRWLNAHGWRTTAGGTWSDRTLRRVLDTGFAAGLFAVDGHLRPGAHDSLIDADLWQAYLDARVVRRALPARTERSPYLLSGMVVCGRCGGSMQAGLQTIIGGVRRPKYRCKNGVESGPARCIGGYVMETHLLELVMDQLRVDAERIEQLAGEKTPRDGRRTALQVERDVAARQLASNEQALTRLAVQHARSPLPHAVYAKAQAELLDQAQQLADVVEMAERELRREPSDPSTVAADLLRDWDDLPVAMRRTLLRRLYAGVVVVPGRPPALRLLEPGGQVLAFRHYSPS